MSEDTIIHRVLFIVLLFSGACMGNISVAASERQVPLVDTSSTLWEIASDSASQTYLAFSIGFAATLTAFTVLPSLMRATFARIFSSRTGRFVLKVPPIVSALVFIVLGTLGIVQVFA